MTKNYWKKCGVYVDINYEKSDEGIAKITINRPEVRNAFRPLTVREMRSALDDAKDDSEIGVIILTGEGEKAFCSGGDQRVRGDKGYEDNETGHMRLNVLDFQREIRTCPKPVIAMVAGGCIRPAEVQRSIRLDVILLLGSLSSFSVALQKTGLADALANNLEYWLQDLPSYTSLLIIFLATTIFTQVISNAASVALLSPVAVQLAPALNLPPIALLITVLFGASQSFLTPMGYQTNLMVFGPGRYRFLDVTRYGAGLTILMTFMIPALILWRYG